MAWSGLTPRLVCSRRASPARPAATQTTLQTHSLLRQSATTGLWQCTQPWLVEQVRLGVVVCVADGMLETGVMPEGCWEWGLAQWVVDWLRSGRLLEGCRKGECYCEA